MRMEIQGGSYGIFEGEIECQEFPENQLAPLALVVRAADFEVFAQ